MAGFELHDHLDGEAFFDSMAKDAREGLTATPKRLPPKYFYDERGSILFEQITEAPEYYPMQTEASILATIAPRLIASMAPREIVELGSGSSTKTRILLEADKASSVLRYVAFDVSESIIRTAAEDLQRLHPNLYVYGMAGDFNRHLLNIPPASGKRLVLFLGSTIGNLHAEERVRLLRGIANLLGRDDRLLLGIDLVKDVGVLERAYNDSQGVTAAFNKNMLNVINRGLDGDFNPDAFEHRAVFNREMSRIEMHLHPLTRQVAHLKAIDLTVEVTPDETIWTESSYKFTPDSAKAMLQQAGMQFEAWYTDPKQYFGLVLASCVG
jgi:L-histidine N-alpha-methyltransferase